MRDFVVCTLHTRQHDHYPYQKAICIVRAQLHGPLATLSRKRHSTHCLVTSHHMLTLSGRLQVGKHAGRAQWGVNCGRTLEPSSPDGDQSDGTSVHAAATTHCYRTSVPYKHFTSVQSCSLRTVNPPATCSSPVSQGATTDRL